MKSERVRRFKIIHLIVTIFLLSFLASCSSDIYRTPSSVESESVEELSSYLNADRFLYYATEFANHHEGKLSPKVVSAIRSLDMHDLSQMKIDYSKLDDAFEYDKWIYKILVDKGVEASQSQINWGYNFLKQKLNEAFRIRSVNYKKSKIVSDTFVPRPVEFDVPVISNDDLTFQGTHYISDRTTRGIFWDSSVTGKKIDFHLGDERLFQKHLSASGGEVIGEVLTKARNYNKIYLVKYPGEDEVRIAITRINGVDRLIHLLYEINLEKLGNKALEKVRLFGDVSSFHEAEERLLSEKLERLPKADRVIIGQKRSIEGFFTTAKKLELIEKFDELYPNQIGKSKFAFAWKTLTQDIKFGTIDILKEDKSIQDIYKAFSKKIEGEFGPLENVRHFNIAGSAYDLSDVVFKNQSGKEIRWRLVSNVWGDEVLPIAKALKNTGHNNISYIGTAGAFPGKGMSVGDLVIPNRVWNQKDGVKKLSLSEELEVDAIRDKVVTQVASPYEEGHAWLEKSAQNADCVEVETDYLERIFNKQDDKLGIYLLIQDVLGTEENLAVNSASKRKNSLNSLIFALAKADDSTFPKVQDPSKIHHFLDEVGQEISKRARALNKDPVFIQFLIQNAKEKGVTKSSVDQYIKSSGAFTTAYLEKKLNLAQDSLITCNEAMFDEFGVVKIAVSNELGNGLWNPKKDKIDLVYLAEDEAQLKKMEEILASNRSVLNESKNVISVHAARGPPQATNTFHLQQLPESDFLTNIYSRGSLRETGLHKSTTYTGRLKFDFLPVTNSSKLCKTTTFCTLHHFLPNEVTSQYLERASKVSQEGSIKFLDQFMKKITSEVEGESRLDFHYKVVDHLESGDEMARIVPQLKGNRRYAFTLEITKEGLEKPYVIFEEIIHLGQIKGLFNSKITHPSIWLEIIWNAQAGSKEAQLMLAQEELDAAILMKKGVDRYYFKLEGDIFSDENFTKYIDSRIEALEVAINDLKKTVKKEKSIRKKIWEKQRGDFSTLEANKEKLNDLVAKNDRKGVARLLEKYIPWPDMDLFEINVWQQWLDAIENPSKDTVLAFRGLDDDHVNKGEKGPFLFSKVLSRNQGSYTRRLRSLYTLRSTLSKLGADQLMGLGLFRKRVKGSFPYKNMGSSLRAHMKYPFGSSYLSFSDFSTAFRFSDGNMAVVKIDKRRMLPNFLSTFTSERELITPLIVFPDEIVAMSMTSGEGISSYGRSLVDVVEKLGMDPANYDRELLFWDEGKFWEDAAKQWNQNLKPTNKIKPTGSCKELVGLFL